MTSIKFIITLVYPHCYEKYWDKTNTFIYYGTHSNYANMYFYKKYI